jgi:hypothetical protein
VPKCYNEHLFSASGDLSLFSRLQSGLESGLPVEAIEWKRSFGRSSKTVCIDADFVKLDAEAATLAAGGHRRLRGCPLLHTFWLECSDLDSYKAFARDDVLAWISTLRKLGPGPSADWVVVLVESADTKKTNKLLPRTSVIDKLKAEIGGKQPERCISLIGENRLQTSISSLSQYDPGAVVCSNFSPVTTPVLRESCFSSL